MTEQQDLNRLRWQCRRGMLELDLLLQAFLETVYPTLDKASKKEFIALLEYPDQLLQRWLIGDGIGVDVQVKSIVNRIRQEGQDYEQGG